MVTLIDALLARGHRVTAITTSADLPLRVDATRWWRGDRFSLACCPMRPRAWPFNGALPGRIVDLYAFERLLFWARRDAPQTPDPRRT